jgi:hypothetical protein
LILFVFVEDNMPAVFLKNVREIKLPRHSDEWKLPLVAQVKKLLGDVFLQDILSHVDNGTAAVLGDEESDKGFKFRDVLKAEACKQQQLTPLKEIHVAGVLSDVHPSEGAVEALFTSKNL